MKEFHGEYKGEALVQEHLYLVRITMTTSTAWIKKYPM